MRKLYSGVPMEVHLRDCPDDLKLALESAIEAKEIIHWHRTRPLQDLTYKV